MHGMAKEMERHPNSTSLENRNNEENDLVRRVTMMLENVQPPEDSIFPEQCIYRVPHRIRLINPKAYTPEVVSIGPIHNPFREGGDSRLKPMEELKLKYLKSFLNRTQISVSDCFSRLKSWEVTMRRCYAEPVELNSDDFLEMVLIDACFIIEFFIRYYRLEDWFGRDPILGKPIMIPIAMEFKLLENQLPFFVLERIYNLSVASSQLTTTDFPTFLDLTFNFFKSSNLLNMTPENVAGRVHHFVDLLRTFLLPVDRQLPHSRAEMVQHLYSASQLLEAGLVFEVSQSKCLLDLKFHKGVLTMPCLKIYDNTEGFMRNIIAFELCRHYPCSRYITQYFTILDFLINTRKDVETLVHKKIIVNFTGDDEPVATLVNSLCSNITLPLITSEFCTLCDELNGFYENPRNKYKAVFIHEYFNTPWKIASTIAAILLLLLTSIQTVCSIVSLFKD